MSGDALGEPNDVEYWQRRHAAAAAVADEYERQLDSLHAEVGRPRASNTAGDWWLCGCCYLNPPEATKCEVCAAARDSEFRLNEKEWTDALLAGAAALEGVADATTGWQSHDARVFASRLRWRAEKIIGPRDPNAPEDPNG